MGLDELGYDVKRSKVKRFAAWAAVSPLPFHHLLFTD